MCSQNYCCELRFVTLLVFDALGINLNDFQRRIAVINAGGGLRRHLASRSRMRVRADCRANSTDAHLICNIVHQTATMESYEVFGY